MTIGQCERYLDGLGYIVVQKRKATVKNPFGLSKNDLRYGKKLNQPLGFYIHKYGERKETYFPKEFQLIQFCQKLLEENHIENE